MALILLSLSVGPCLIISKVSHVIIFLFTLLILEEGGWPKGPYPLAVVLTLFNCYY